MKYLRTFGKFLISVGVGVLLFVAWTLWGTGIYTSQQQDQLQDEYAALPDFAAASSDNGEPVRFNGPPESYRPGPGDPVFRMRIPKMDFDKMIVEGVGVEDLKKGPGHYPQCREGFDPPLCTEFEEMWPGENGRVVVSGHRTTYGAPFWDLNKLKPGDKIHTETRWGDFTYTVTETTIVEPESLAIVVDKGRPEIVLTTCNPRFSAAQRMVVYAELDNQVAQL